MGVVTVPTGSWTYFVDFPDEGWISLPEPDETVVAWAEDVCDDLYATGATRTDLAEQLRTCGASWRERGDDTGALWVPDVEYGILATMTARTVGGDDFTLEKVEEFWRAGSDPAMGPAQITRVDLPAGPAVRVRRLEAGGGDWARSLVSEIVAHTLVPGDLIDVKGKPTGVEQVVTWTMVQEGDELAKLADELAALLAIERH